RRGAGPLALARRTPSTAAGRLRVTSVEPSQPRPPVSPHRPLLIGAAVAALVLFLLLVGSAYGWLLWLDAKLAVKYQRLQDLEAEEKSLQADVKAHDAVQEGANASPNWLDELYDTTALFPDPDQVRLTQWKGTTQSLVDKDKTKYVGKISLEGRTGQNNKKQLDTFRQELDRDAHYRTSAKGNEDRSTRG